MHSLRNGVTLFALDPLADALRLQPTDKAVFKGTEVTADSAAPEAAAAVPEPAAGMAPEPGNDRPLEHQPWFRTGVSREQVEELLADTPRGTFLVRASTKAGYYAMTVQEGPRRVTILLTPVAAADGSPCVGRVDRQP